MFLLIMFWCFSQSWQCQLSPQTMSVLQACYLQIFWWKGNVLLFLFPSNIIKLNSENQNSVGHKLWPEIGELIAPCIVVDVLHKIAISFAQIWSFIVIFFPRIGWWDLCQHIFSILSHDDCAFWHIGWSYQGPAVEIMLQSNFSQSSVMFICFFSWLQKHVSVRWVSEAYIR